MAARIIEVRYRELQNTASIFEQHSDIIKKLQQQLQACETPLKQGGWTADSADDFYRDLSRDLHPALERLAKALDLAGATTLKIVQTYRLAELQACDAIPQNGSSAMDRFLDAYRENIQADVSLPKQIYDAVAQAGKLFGALGKSAPEGWIKKPLEQLGRLDISQTLAETIKNSAWGQKLGGELSKAADKLGTGELSTLLRNSEGLTKFGGGLVGGVVDFALGGKYTGEEAVTQLGSGAIQGAIAMTGVGEGVLLADAGIQLVGGVAAKAMRNNAAWFATNGTSSEEIVSTANRLDEGLKAMSVDNRIDGLVNAVYHGDVEKGFDEVGTFFLGIGQTAVEGGRLGTQALGGALNHLFGAN